ncbi:helix-turn-helix domain-containing protein [Actinocorallia sp. API 0066]|uniref:helix-turn-helix domain-containing protein n=1 Tax=Actinocorallia sp. API 0066 TaxID=2896846 RepID=UPI001E50BD66|nr:helix-turn-helix domain-containing protein [Actinocorallia sp. API 0066]MCD0453312.1 helix-turn-helix domain-containing protein [Actinocorallia sp. API 0066]
MGRLEQRLDPEAGPLQRFAQDLRDLRRRAGSPSYRDLAARTHYSASTLAAAASGLKLPTEPVLAAYVTACGGDPHEWEGRRRKLSLLMSAAVVDEEVEPEMAGTPSEAEAPVPPVAPRRTVDVSRFRTRTFRNFVTRWASVLSLVLLFLVFLQNLYSPEKPSHAEVPLDSPKKVAGDQELRADSDVPPIYRPQIMAAANRCPAPEVTPALVAAILKVESGFDPNLADPAKDEYGIARWTPRVLRHYLPLEQQAVVPEPPFTAEESIAALGRMLCTLAPILQGVPGDAALNLAAAYRTSTWTVQQQGPGLRKIAPYLDKVRTQLHAYTP